MLVLSLFLAVAVAGLGVALVRHRRTGPPTGRTSLSAEAFKRARQLGARDAAADIPSSVTAEPWVPHQMSGFYAAGDEERAVETSRHLEATGDLRKRLPGLTARFAAAAGHPNEAAASERLKAAQEALRLAEEALETRYAKVDFQTYQLVLEYWASNIASRDATERDNLSNLVVPTPADWRKAGAASEVPDGSLPGAPHSSNGAAMHAPAPIPPSPAV